MLDRHDHKWIDGATSTSSDRLSIEGPVQLELEKCDTASVRYRFENYFHNYVDKVSQELLPSETSHARGPMTQNVPYKTAYTDYIRVEL